MQLRRHYDSAYGCFFLVGAVVLATTLVVILQISLSEGTLALVGLSLMLLMFGALPALLGASVRSRQRGTGGDVKILWQHMPLRVLSLLTLLGALLLILGMLQSEDVESTTLLDAVGPAYGLVYGLATSALSIRWFLSLRRRARD